MAKPPQGPLALFAAGCAAVLASACCLGPLVLVTIGISGAWIGNLSVLEPYRPIFIGVAVFALFFSYRKIFRSAVVCTPTQICAGNKVRLTYKIIFAATLVLVLIALLYPYLIVWFY